MDNLDLRHEAAEWLTSMGAILLAISVFNPIVGTMARGGVRFVDCFPLFGGITVILAGIAFVLARRRLYGAVRTIGITCAVLDGLALLGLMLQLSSPEGTEFFRQRYHFSETEVKYLGYEMKDGVFYLGVALASVIFGGSLGEARSDRYR